jgi:hypothetical protein
MPKDKLKLYNLEKGARKRKFKKILKEFVKRIPCVLD